MFLKKWPIDDFVDLMDKEDIKREDSEIIQLLIGNGYDVKIVTRTGEPLSLFDKETSVTVKNKNASAVMWKMTELILNSKKPLFIILQLVNESHPPYLSPDLDSFSFKYPHSIISDAIYRQMECAIKYLDGQLRFYSELLSKDSVKIYMSDHGKGIFANNPIDDKYLHTFLFVNGNGIKPQDVDHMFDLYNFMELVRYVIQPKESTFEKMFPTDFVRIQAIDYYNETAIDVHIKLNKRFISFAARGIVTKTDKYCILSTGEEFYYVRPDDDENKADDPQYAERIKELRNTAGDKFLNIYQFSRFQHTHRLYEHYGLEDVFEKPMFLKKKRR